MFGSERALARYLADEHDHDISNLATYDDIRTAANDGSLRVNVSDENVYVLTEIVDYLAEGPDAIDRDQLELAVELLRDVGEYAEDTVVEESLDADQPLGKVVAYVLDPDKVRKPDSAVRQGGRAVGSAGSVRRIAAAARIALQLRRFRVARLVETEVTAAGQPDAGQQAPALVADRAARHAFGGSSSTVALTSSHIRYSSCEPAPSAGCTATSAGGSLKISQPPPASTCGYCSTSRKNARSASASRL